MDDKTLAQHVGKQADITGVARDAMAGAVVLTDDRTPVYIDGLRAWDDSVSGSRVRVSGTLRHRGVAPTASVAKDGSVSHGMDGASYVLEDASWQVEGA